MIKTIFCLSMPGGHMTYLGLLTKLLLGHLKINYDFITENGSAHGANTYFSSCFSYDYDDDEWDTWYQNNLKEFSSNKVCIIKDSWSTFDQKKWEQKINGLTEAYVVCSSPITKLDWIYSWINITEKAPSALYGHLKIHNPYFPIWHMLTNEKKLKFLSKSMPVYPLEEKMLLKVPNYKVATTDILKKDFLINLHTFLLQNNFNSVMSNDIISFHNYFIKKQSSNLKFAKNIDSNIKFPPRNMFDKILFNWLNTNPWEELE